MKKQLRLTVLLAFGLAVSLTQGASARVISTFDPGGMDAEVREAAPTTVFGNGAELGMRVANANNPAAPSGNHNGHVYMKFGVQGVNAANLNHPITVRTSWMLNNLGNNRIEDILDLDNAQFADRPNVSFDYYVLNPNNAKANWNETTMTYGGPSPATWAPGLQVDFNTATKDIIVNAANFTYLGNNELRSLARNGNGPGSVPIENRIPLGEDFDLVVNPGSPLHAAIVAAQATGHQTVTILGTLAHDNLTNPNVGWQNHNYVWTSKEKNPMNTDAAYDSDNTDPNNPLGSPYNGAANTAATPFAPRLVMVPEPSSMLLLGLCGLSLLGRRRV